MVVILLFALVFIVILTIKSQSNFFYPSKAYPYFLLIYVVPYTILYLIKGSSILEPASTYHIRADLNYLMIHFLSLTILTLVSFLIGVRLVASRKKKVIKSIKNKTEPTTIRNIARIFFLISILLFYFYYQSLGGISFYLDNLAYRSEMTRGAGYLMALLNFCVLFSSGLFLFALKKNQIKRHFFWVVIVLSIAMLIIGGSRAIVIRYVVILLILAYFLFKPSNKQLLSAKNKFYFLAVVFITMLYVIVVPTIRTSTLRGKIDLSHSFGMALKETETIAKGNIYSEIQLNILKVFEKTEHWYGRSFIDLLYIPLPRSYMPNKPSADDGIYIYNLIRGNSQDLGTDISQSSRLILQSWPPSTFGNGYANFGYIGAILFFFILGILISLSYRLMVNSQENFIYIFLYTYIFWRLQLSNLLIVEVLTVILLLLISVILFPRLRNIYI